MTVRGNAFLGLRSFEDFFVPVTEEGTYEVILTTDDHCFGGFSRIYHQSYDTVWENGRIGVRLYLPSRTAVVLKKK